MPFIKPSEFHYINPAHIVEFTYTPSSTSTIKKKDKADYGSKKTLHRTSPSSLSIVMSSGKPLSYSDVQADELYETLKKLG